eukprot:3169453-Pyramimonas_sp.AAC.3
MTASFLDYLQFSPLFSPGGQRNTESAPATRYRSSMERALIRSTCTQKCEDRGETWGIVWSEDETHILIAHIVSTLASPQIFTARSCLTSSQNRTTDLHFGGNRKRVCEHSPRAPRHTALDRKNDLVGHT